MSSEHLTADTIHRLRDLRDRSDDEEERVRLSNDIAEYEGRSLTGDGHNRATGADETA